MAFYSVWFYLVEMTLIALLASTALLRQADKPPTDAPARVETLDGLRGFLAFGVFFDHSAIYHGYITTGQWIPSPSVFYTGLGRSGVGLFFMITGYLFWSQVLAARGRLNFLKLYCGRVFRIVPLYLALAVIVLITVAVMSHWERNVPVRALVEQSASWLAGGVIVGHQVNGFIHTGTIAAGVTWTLQYEWLFYASLLGTSFFARNRAFGLLLPIIGMGITVPALVHHMHSRILLVALTFCVGMLSASIRKRYPLAFAGISQWQRSAIAAACLALPFLLFNDIYGVAQILLLGAGFIFIVQDSTLFGLLLTRPAKRLGDISYGIYLLQGPVLFVAFAPAWVRSQAAQHALIHWSVVFVAAVVLMLTATAAHVLIEIPGVKLGKWTHARMTSFAPAGLMQADAGLVAAPKRRW